DGVVRLRDVAGQAYQGTLQINADLDFSGSATRLDFAKLDAHGLNVRQLPESWGLPPQLEGRLDAAGDVHLTLANGPIATTVDAHAEVRDARIAGQPVDGPIELQLSPAGPPLQTDPTQDGVVEEQPLAPAQRKLAPHYLTVKMKLDKADLHQVVEKFKLNV